MITPRPRPYIWATWLAEALVGDDKCEWKLWLKTHHQYDKVQEPDEQRNNLAVWKSQHGSAVSARKAELEAEGWVVSVEDQNKFHVRGRTTTVGGAADILATRRAVEIEGGERLLVRGGAGVIEDIKTGRPRDRDFWQVVVYLTMLPLAKPELVDVALTGRVIYTADRSQDLTVTPLPEARAQVFARIHALEAKQAPARTPSARECAYCDILDCEDRVREKPGETETEVF